MRTVEIKDSHGEIVITLEADQAFEFTRSGITYRVEPFNGQHKEVNSFSAQAPPVKQGSTFDNPQSVLDVPVFERDEVEAMPMSRPKVPTKAQAKAMLEEMAKEVKRLGDAVGQVLAEKVDGGGSIIGEAKRFGISDSMLHNIRNGSFTFISKTVLKVLEAYGVKLPPKGHLLWDHHACAYRLLVNKQASLKKG